MCVASHFSSLCKVHNVEFSKFATTFFVLNAVHFFFIPAFLHIFYLFLVFCAISLRKFVARLQLILSPCTAQNMNKKTEECLRHSSVLRFVVFMGGEVGEKFVASRPPLTRCAGAPL